MKSTATYVVIAILFCLITSCSTTYYKEGGKIPATKIINSIEKDKNIFIKDATIVGDIDFTSLAVGYIKTPGVRQTDVNVSLTFINCEFSGSILGFSKPDKHKFNITTFSRNVSFYQCRFLSKIDFRECQFNGYVNFNQTEFNEDAIFQGVSFRDKKNYFKQTKFKKRALFQQAFFDGEVHFLQAEFTDKAYFQGVDFDGIAQFGGTKFGGVADFSMCNASKDFLFNFAKFYRRATFNNAVLRGRTEFNDGNFSNGAVFENVLFYGQTSFNNLKTSNVIRFNNSSFVFGKPDLKSISDTLINYDNAKFHEWKSITK